jgi:hypothetical protein
VDITRLHRRGSILACAITWTAGSAAEREWVSGRTGGRLRRDERERFQDWVFARLVCRFVQSARIAETLDQQLTSAFTGIRSAGTLRADCDRDGNTT